MRFISFITRSLPAATLVLAGALVAQTPAPVISADGIAASTYSSYVEGEVYHRLRQIQSRAYELNVQADALQSYTRGERIGWQTHAVRLNSVREHINAIGRDLQYLQSVQADSAEWQKVAIERMVPIAASVADRTEAAIRLLNDNRKHLSLAEYKSHVQALSEDAELLKQSIDPFVELDKTLTKLEAVEDTLAMEDVSL